MTPTPAQAFWRQRNQLSSKLGRWNQLMTAVDRAVDFSPHQWLQIAAMVLEFKPDVIIELGRGVGNSTACFLEAIHQNKTHRPCRLFSACLTDAWRNETAPRLRAKANCDDEWFESAEIFEGDLLKIKHDDLIQNDKRCLVFWDAHGYEVAHWVMSGLLPLLAQTEHVVLMHDMCDSKLEAAPEYEKFPFWNGENSVGFVQLGDVCTGVGQGVAMSDFANRNQMPLHTAKQSFVHELESDPSKKAELLQLFGSELDPISVACWAWFTLNEAVGPITYPDPQTPKTEIQKTRELNRRLQEKHSRLQQDFDHLVGLQNQLQQQHDDLKLQLDDWHASRTMRIRNGVMRVPGVSHCLRTIFRKRSKATS